jgi:hypothetical protein
MYRPRSLLLLVLSFDLWACSLEPLDLTDKPCPCAEGYLCDDVANRCVATDAPSCEPMVTATGFAASWATSNTIRWQWEPVGDPADFVRYEISLVEVGSDGGARTVGSDQNPELRGFFIPRTVADDDVLTSTLVGDLEPMTTYAAYLLITDTSLCEFRSEQAAISTLAELPEEAVIFRGAALGRLRPDSLAVTDSAVTYVPDDDTDCADAGEVCSQNLQLWDLDLDLSDMTEGQFANAFMELTVEYDGATPSYFSRVWLTFDDRSLLYRHEPFTLAATQGRHVVQVPLSDLRLDGEALTHAILDTAAMGTPLSSANLGGQWTRSTEAGDPSAIRIHEMLIRY